MPVRVSAVEVRTEAPSLTQRVLFNAPVSFASKEPTEPPKETIIPTPPEPAKPTIDQINAVVKACEDAGLTPGAVVLRVERNKPNYMVGHWHFGFVHYLHRNLPVGNEPYAPLMVKFSTNSASIKLWPDEVFLVHPATVDSEVKAAIEEWRKTAGELPNAKSLGLV